MLVWTLDSCRLTQPNFYEPTVLSALFFQRILFPDASQRKASPVGQVFVRNSRAQDMFYSWTTTAASGIQDTWDERGKACVSHHFLCVCMCISSDGCRLRSAWATDFYPVRWMVANADSLWAKNTAEWLADKNKRPRISADKLYANKVKQIWSTPLKALHFHQRAICRQTGGKMI